MFSPPVHGKLQIQKIRALHGTDKQASGCARIDARYRRSSQEVGESLAAKIEDAFLHKRRQTEVDRKLFGASNARLCIAKSFPDEMREEM